MDENILKCPSLPCLLGHTCFLHVHFQQGSNNICIYIYIILYTYLYIIIYPISSKVLLLTTDLSQSLKRQGAVVEKDSAIFLANAISSQNFSDTQETCSFACEVNLLLNQSSISQMSASIHSPHSCPTRSSAQTISTSEDKARLPWHVSQNASTLKRQDARRGQQPCALCFAAQVCLATKAWCRKVCKQD